MANNSVRGLTVEISADTKNFKKGMDTMRNDAKSTQKDLKTLQNQLKLDYNEDKLKEAQKIAQESLDKTTRNADILRERLKYLEDAGKIDSTEYQRLKDELGRTETKALELKKSLEALDQVKLNHIKENLDKAANTMKGVSAAAAGVVTALSATGLAAVATADEIATLAVKYDTTAEAIQRMNYVALQTDTASNDLYKGLTKIRSAVSEIETGASSASASALKSLGLSLNSINGTEAQFYTIISALSDMEDETRMVAIANDIFGEQLANNLLPIIKAGSDAIYQYANEFTDLGALTNNQTQALAEFDNVLNKIGTQLKNIATQIGASLLPIMQKVADFVSQKLVPKLQDLAGFFSGLNDAQLAVAMGMLVVTASIAPMLSVLSKVVSIGGSIMNVIQMISSALSLLAAHPIIAAIAGVVAVLGILYTRCEDVREMIDSLANLFTGTISSVINSVINALRDAIASLLPFISTVLTLVGNLFSVGLNILTNLLAPIVSVLQILMGALQPLINVALIPLRLALAALQIPLQMLSQLVSGLTPIFKAFGEMVESVMDAAVGAINVVLGVVEDSLNWVIDKINFLIDGINNALGLFGVSIDHIGNVSLKIKTTKETIDSNLSNRTNNNNFNYDDFLFDNKDYTYNGDVYNYDYSRKETTQNVTVTIENYASEVDVEDLVRKINMRLAEEM